MSAGVDLTGARVFKETPRETSARWYVLPDGRVFHSRDRGHLEPSLHTARDVEGSEWLVEVPQ